MIRSNTMHIATMPTAAAGKIGGTQSAQSWFAGGERVGYDPKLGLQIVRLPGGHLTTNEQPEALAASIAKFERGLSTRRSRL